MDNQTNNVEFVKKISVPDTLLSIEVGKTVRIPTNIIKTSAIRTAAVRLQKKRKAKFFVTEQGLINETQVTRLK